jgi:hypothetical protein
MPAGTRERQGDGASMSHGSQVRNGRLLTHKWNWKELGQLTTRVFTTPGERLR